MSFDNRYNNNWMNTAGSKGLVEQKASKIIAGVYGWMSLGVLISALVGFSLVGSGAMMTLLQAGTGLVMGLFIVQLGLVFGMSFAANKMSSSTLKGLFLLYSAITGVTFGIILLVYTLESVISIFFVAAFAYAALAAFGAITKKNLGFMGTFLMMGLVMVIGVGIVNLFVHSELLSKLSGWIGIIVFSGLTAYDSQRIRDNSIEISYSGDVAMSQRFMILGALTMYLNFFNLFISLLQIFGGRRD